jgi:hypothetical protein
VTLLEECITKEQRSVVRFLWAKGLNAKNIHKEMRPVYSGKCFSCKPVHNWVENSSQSSKVTDDARPGSPIEIATQATVKRMEELNQADKRITIV